jgi:hypothetical protein
VGVRPVSEVVAHTDVACSGVHLTGPVPHPETEVLPGGSEREYLRAGISVAVILSDVDSMS